MIDVATEVKEQLAGLRDIVREVVYDELKARELDSRKIDDLKTRLRFLEDREETRMKAEKRNTIIIRGMDLREEDAKPMVDALLRQRLGVNVTFNNLKIMEVSVNKRFAALKLRSYDDKQKIMSSKGKLKGSETFITNDRTKKEREV